jgi:membrane dipeptidase
MRSVAAAAVAAATLIALPAHAKDEAELRRRALALHRSAIVVDTHNDVTTPIVDKHHDLGPRARQFHTDLPRLREGGVGAVFMSIFVATTYTGNGALKRALAMMDGVYEQIRRHPDELGLATSVAEVRRLRQHGKIAALMGIEGGHAIEDSLAALRMLFRMGARYMTLTHISANSLGDSSTDRPKHGGLSPFGQKVVAEMNRLGMMVDISHVADTTARDALRLSRAPVIASHSSCRALCAIPRNLPDDLLKAVGQKGGVVMINFGSAFVDRASGQHFNAKLKALRPQLEALKSRFPGDTKKLHEEAERIFAAYNLAHPAPPAPTLKKVVDHIEHVIRVAGEDAVGFGSDYDGVDQMPRGLEDVSKYPELTVELLRRGHSEARIKKILGENLLRVMSEVERVAAAAAPAAAVQAGQ